MSWRIGKISFEFIAIIRQNIFVSNLNFLDSNTFASELTTKVSIRFGSKSSITQYLRPWSSSLHGVVKPKFESKVSNNKFCLQEISLQNKKIFAFAHREKASI